MGDEIKQFLEEVDRTFRLNANPANAKAMKAYMKNRYEFYGIKSPQRKELMQEVIRDTRKYDKFDVLRIIDGLWKLPHREHQMVAMEIGRANLKRWDETDLPFWLDINKRKSWWDTVDFIASTIIGHIMKQVPEEKRKQYALTWITHEHLWMKRVALLYQLKWKEETNDQLLYKMINQIKQDKEFFLQKGAGWALRQYSKYNPTSVQNYISSNSDSLSKLTIREGSKYL